MRIASVLADTKSITKIAIGGRAETLMLDGGSGVNSIPEDLLVVAILNENRLAGIRLSDKRRPTNQLGRWKQKEEALVALRAAAKDRDKAKCVGGMAARQAPARRPVIGGTPDMLLPDGLVRTPCRFYQMGRCNKGQACYYEH